MRLTRPDGLRRTSPYLQKTFLEILQLARGSPPWFPMHICVQSGHSPKFLQCLGKRVYSDAELPAS